MKGNGGRTVKKKARGELQAKDTWYPRLMRDLEKMNQRAETGQIVVRAKETPWMQNRNAKVRYYFMPYKTDTALQTMQAFEHVIHRHSGKHRHQGGLVIFIIEGEGYSIVDGERHDWEAGDLLLLPFKPGGVEHQHFNKEEGQPAKWIAFISAQLFEWGASDMVQVKELPEWREKSQRDGRRARQ